MPAAPTDPLDPLDARELFLPFIGFISRPNICAAATYNSSASPKDRSRRHPSGGRKLCVQRASQSSLSEMSTAVDNAWINYGTPGFLFLFLQRKKLMEFRRFAHREHSQSDAGMNVEDWTYVNVEDWTYVNLVVFVERA